jgi:hypothetical protein
LVERNFAKVKAIGSRPITRSRNLYMIKHIIAEDIVPKHLQDRYAKDFRTFNWKYLSNTKDDGTPVINKEIFDVGQLVFKLFGKSDYATMTGKDPYPMPNVFPIFQGIDREIRKVMPFKEIMFQRVKFNLMWKAPEANGRWSLPHIDHSDIDAVSAVYYVVDADGDTCLFYPKETVRVRPKKGSVLIFPSNIPHASSSPVEAQERVVINIVMKIVKE